jgi:hypothetical protein
LTLSVDLVEVTGENGEAGGDPAVQEFSCGEGAATVIAIALFATVVEGTATGAETKVSAEASARDRVDWLLVVLLLLRCDVSPRPGCPADLPLSVPGIG